VAKVDHWCCIFLFFYTKYSRCTNLPKMPKSTHTHTHTHTKDLFTRSKQFIYSSLIKLEVYN